MPSTGRLGYQTWWPAERRERGGEGGGEGGEREGGEGISRLHQCYNYGKDGNKNVH